MANTVHKLPGLWSSLRQAWKDLPTDAILITIGLLGGLCLAFYLYMKVTIWPPYVLECVTGILGVGGLLLYVYRSGHYTHLLNDTVDRMHLAPILVKGSRKFVRQP